MGSSRRAQTKYIRSLAESAAERFPNEVAELESALTAYENSQERARQLKSVRRHLLECYRLQFNALACSLEKYRHYFPNHRVPPCDQELSEAALPLRRSLAAVAGNFTGSTERHSRKAIEETLESAATTGLDYLEVKEALAKRLTNLAHLQAQQILAVREAKKKKITAPKPGESSDQAISKLTEDTAEVLHRAALLASKELELEDGASEDDAYSAIDDLEMQSIFDDLADSASDALEPVLKEQGRAALADLKIDAKSITDLVNQNAMDYAKERGAELVGRKWVDDKLVDNPDAKWAITETTREGLKDLLVKGYEEGWIPAQLKKEIADSYNFSKDRAETIARTETRKASMQGTLLGWRESGVVRGKFWLLSGDHGDTDDLCDDNADAGEVDLDDDFPSGDDAPPQHPNCSCTLSAALDTDPEPNDEEEEGE